MSYKTRKIKDNLVDLWIRLMVILVVILPLFIAFSLLGKSWLILGHTGLSDLLFSSVWRPLAGEFGFWPFIISSVWVTFIGIVTNRTHMSAFGNFSYLLWVKDDYWMYATCY
jgi:phosphate transport system permease protein